MEKISVIVPVYKVEQYLNRCVQSILDQTYKNIEIILVDDGSPDKCGAICDIWAKKDARIRVIHKENGGLSDARNAGLAIATGELVSFIDSDDWIDGSFLEVLYAALTENRADIAECSVTYVDEIGNVIRKRNAVNIRGIEKIEALRRLMLEDGVYQTVWNKLYHRSAIEGILFEKGKCNEDEFWTYRVLDRINRMAMVQKPLYFYLQRATSIMGKNYSLKRLDSLEARFQRMVHFQKYEELALLSRVHLQLNCMYHYQCVLRYLPVELQKSAEVTIKNILQRIPRTVPGAVVSPKQRIWLKSFYLQPRLTAKIRNLLGIGL